MKWIAYFGCCTLFRSFWIMIGSFFLVQKKHECRRKSSILHLLIHALRKYHWKKELSEMCVCVCSVASPSEKFMNGISTKRFWRLTIIQRVITISIWCFNFAQRCGKCFTTIFKSIIIISVLQFLHHSWISNDCRQYA